MTGISFREIASHDRYKLLCGVVVPRPIALVTTCDENGIVNAAPFSFFNAFSEDPPLVVLGLQHRADLTPKDTTRNIRRDGLIDRSRMRVNLDAYRPIGRLFGNLYATQRDRFALPRESHAQWLARVKPDHVKAGDGADGSSGENQ